MWLLVLITQTGGSPIGLLESRIPQFLTPFNQPPPPPTSTFILILSAKVHVSPAHCNISSNEGCTYMALHCCKRFPLEDKDQRLLKDVRAHCYCAFFHSSCIADYEGKQTWQLVINKDFPQEWNAKACGIMG